MHFYNKKLNSLGNYEAMFKRLYLALKNIAKKIYHADKKLEISVESV